jgi:hypothetical protein
MTTMHSSERVCLWTAALDSAVTKELVLVAAGAVRALQAADEEQGHAHRSQDGEDFFMHRKPVNQTNHCLYPRAYSKNLAAGLPLLITRPREFSGPDSRLTTSFIDIFFQFFLVFKRRNGEYKTQW